MTTNVPEIEWGDTGLVIPTEAEILEGVQEDFNAAFGGNLNPSLVSPQGQLSSSIAAMISNGYTTFGTFVNQVDPDTSTGFMQDAIGRFYFMERNGAVATVVNVQCNGTLGTQITAGASFAQDTSGNIYVCTASGVIPVGGNVVLPFANVVAGPTACPANTVTKIYQAQNGWESCNNSSSGVIGANVETPAAFEYRREQSVGINAQGSLPAIYSNCFDVPNVIDVFVTANPTDSVVSGSIAGNPNSTSFPVAARSIYVAVSGGDAMAVCTAVWQAANIGPGYQTVAGGAGATLITETVQDTSGYSNPIPEYVIGVINPAPTDVFYAVTLEASALLPANIVTLVQQAIIAQFSGQTQGSTRERIGSQILASRYYGPVQAIGTEVSILTIFIGFTSTPTSPSLQMGIDQIPTVTAGNIAVTVA